MSQNVSSHGGPDQVHQNIYTLLASPDPYTNHFRNRKKSQSGTGTWLLNSKRYEAWVFKSGSFLWLYGIRKSNVCPIKIITKGIEISW